MRIPLSAEPVCAFSLKMYVWQNVCLSDSYCPPVASRLSRSSPASVKCSPRLTLQIHSGRPQRKRDEDTWPISPSRNHCSGCCGKTGPDQQEAVSQPIKWNWRLSKKTKCCNKKINKRLKLQSDDRELGKALCKVLTPAAFTVKIVSWVWLSCKEKPKTDKQNNKRKKKIM